MFGLDKTTTRIVAILAACALLALIFAVASCHHASTTTSVVKATGRNDAAKDQASIERGNDTAAILNNQQERTDAIKSAPKGETGPATRALNCARWMRANPGKAKPAGC